MPYVVLLALLWSGAAAAQTPKAKPPPKQPAPAPAEAPKAPPTSWPIQSLAVEGNQNYTKEQILAVTGLKIGETAGRQEFEAAQQRLEATGAFETVSYKFGPSADASGYAATFQVLEVEPVYPIRFTDLGIPDAEVGAYLKARSPLFGAKIPATKAILDRYAKLIQDLADSRHIQERVMAKLQPVGADQFVIIFRPNRPEAAVAEVTFEGNQVVPAEQLREAIYGVAIGAAYSEPAFRELLNNSVKPLYDARGRIRASFPKITSEKSRSVDGVAVHVTVDEGPSFDLGEIKLDNKSSVKTEELLKTGNFKKGDLANFDDVNQGVERIRKRLRREGYMRAGATVNRTVHDDTKKVDVLVHIDEGPQFTFSKLTVNGLDLDGEAAIRKLWSMKEGKAFNPEYPDFFLAQVKDRGIFDDLGETKALVDVNEPNLTASVTLNFHGSSTGSGAASREKRRRPDQ
jgi:outer membrane protein insertion porin family